jgi:hypothetical protein
MKIKTVTEVEVKTLRVVAEARYWEDSTVNGVEDTEGTLIPCRDGDNWCPVIDVETGIITNWEKGKTAEIHYKVCDQCSWSLLDTEDNVVATQEDDYVPDTLCPEGDGYGDYIIMNIDENGQIQNWKFNEEDFSNVDDN